MRRRQAIGLAAAAGAAALLGRSGPARAAAEMRGVSVIVPDFPTAPAGIAARVLWAPLARALGRPVMLDFRPGAGGIVGLMAGARAAADGHSLTLLTPALVAAPWLAGRMDNTPADFALIGRISFTPEVLLVASSSPWHRLADLLAALRAGPGRVRTAFDDAWTSAEIAELMMLDRAGLAARPVAGLRAGPALRDGRIGFVVRPLPWALTELAAGGVRALAVSAPRAGGGAARRADFPGAWDRCRDRVLAGAGGAGRGRGRQPGAGTGRAGRGAAGTGGAGCAGAGRAAAGLAGGRAGAGAIAAEYQALGRLFTAAGVNVRQAAMAAR